MEHAVCILFKAQVFVDFSLRLTQRQCGQSVSCVWFDFFTQFCFGGVCHGRLAYWLLRPSFTVNFHQMFGEHLRLLSLGL